MGLEYDRKASIIFGLWTYVINKVKICIKVILCQLNKRNKIINKKKLRSHVPRWRNRREFTYYVIHEIIALRTNELTTYDNKSQI